VVQLDEVPDDGQPDAEPAVAAAGPGVLLPETLEKVGDEGRIDAPARVRDLESGNAALPGQAHVHPLARRRELDGVGDQVRDDLLQSGHVPEDRGIRVDATPGGDVLGLGGRP